MYVVNEFKFNKLTISDRTQSRLKRVKLHFTTSVFFFLEYQRKRNDV